MLQECQLQRSTRIFCTNAVGTQAFLPGRFNVLTDNDDGSDILVSDLLSVQDYLLINNRTNDITCSDGRTVVGIPLHYRILTARVFSSPSLIFPNIPYQISDKDSGRYESIAHIIASELIINCWKVFTKICEVS